MKLSESAKNAYRALADLVFFNPFVVNETLPIEEREKISSELKELNRKLYAPKYEAAYQAAMKFCLMYKEWKESHE